MIPRARISSALVFPLSNSLCCCCFFSLSDASGPGMSLENDENFDHSLLLFNTENPEKNGEVGGNSNPDLRICYFSLDDTFDSKNPGYSCSLSFPSEPPDIRDFFSSYIYESPDLDTGEDFSNVASGESEIDKALAMPEDSDKTDKKAFGAHRTSADIDSSFCEELSFEADTKLQDHSSAKDNRNLVATNTGETKSLEHKQVGNYDLVPIENDGKSGSSDWDSLRKLEEEFFAKKGDHILSKTSIKYETSDEQNSLELRCLTIEAGHDADSRKSNGDSSKKVLPCSNSEEQIQGTTMDGFVSTKKNYPRSENSRSFLKRSQEDLVEHKRKTPLVPPVKEMHTQVVERRPLVEKTNFLKDMAIPEVTGKWRCPQKSKPDLGPPTKQLRLERWIHRL